METRSSVRKRNGDFKEAQKITEDQQVEHPNDNGDKTHESSANNIHCELNGSQSDKNKFSEIYNQNWRRNCIKTMKNYFYALRPWSFTASICPVFLGSILAYRATDTFNPLLCLCVMLAVLAVHGAGNLVNTYYDYVKGVDKEESSDDRALVDKILTLDSVATFGAVLYFFGCLFLFFTCLLSPAQVEHLAFGFFGGLSASFVYTGGPGLKRVALGDILIFFSFGPLTVLFSFLAQTGVISTVPCWYAVPLALNASAILHANNYRDMETDAKAGIVTVAILLGETYSYLLFVFLLFVPYVILICLTLNSSVAFAIPSATVALTFNIERNLRRKRLKETVIDAAKLNFLLGVTYIIGCFLCPMENLPFFTLT